VKSRIRERYRSGSSGLADFAIHRERKLVAIKEAAVSNLHNKGDWPMDSMPLKPRNSATLGEILTQPEAWQKTLEAWDISTVFANVVKQTSSRTTWLFIGCGTSYYLAEAAASAWRLQTGQSTSALPASEVMLFPDTALLGTAGLQAVIISRSGETSESVQAADTLQRVHKIPTLALTCTAGSPLERACALSLTVRWADEKSMVMTRSFTSMLLTLQYLAAQRSGSSDFTASLKSLAGTLAPKIASLSERVEDFVKKHTFSHYVFLGQGPFHGIAQEGALKITEMSCSFGQAYHTLEFRHGPKATVTPDTCLVFLLSESGNDAERRVLKDMKGLGGIIVTVCNRASPEIRNASDLLLEFGSDVTEAVLLVPFVVPSQLLGFYTGIKKGLTPDTPRNLSRVVILS
jgi:glutamine---fructose-6-phosphate transaminase (isomerizing)